jgi:hypothetical protein
MKSYLKRFLKFEEEYGDQEGVEHVKSIAKDYLEQKCI